MRFSSLFAAALLSGFVAFSSTSIASQFNGRWIGTGEAVSGDCSDIEIWVTVDGNNVDGEVLTIDRSFEIKGNLSGEGRLYGQVIKIGFAVAEITGAIHKSSGSGEWRTVRGEDCRGTFAVQKQAG